MTQPLSVAQAQALIAEHSKRLGTEQVQIGAAPGRVLAQEIIAERDQPPFDRVTMDGIAICLAGNPNAKTFKRQATQFAGDSALTLSSKQHCIEIMTGAALPHGCDTVVAVERISQEKRAGELWLTLEANYQPEQGQFIHPRGSDHRQAAVLLVPGTHIGATEIAVIASAGRPSVEVSRLPRVSVIATGNELVAAGEPINESQIRASNGPALVAALSSAGYTNASAHHFLDEREALTLSIGALLEEDDVLVLSGGVSKGKADFIPSVLAELGVQCHFHRVAQRPGKPLWYGTGKRGQQVFALPGNPVSTLVCMYRYVIPALHLASGRAAASEEIVTLLSDWEFKAPLTAFVPVTLSSNEQAQLCAQIKATNTSGDFTALAGTAGFVELPAATQTFAAGFKAKLIRW